VSLLALDSNVFIAALSGAERYSDAAAELIRSIGSGKNSAVYSTLALTEVLSLSKTEVRGLSVNEFFEQLTGAQPYPISVAIGSLAGSLRVQHPSLRLADAIHLATALDGKVDVFITDDRPLTKVSKTLIKTRTLAEWSGK
jgi:predicted nucleic acid-binding protein